VHWGSGRKGSWKWQVGVQVVFTEKRTETTVPDSVKFKGGGKVLGTN